MLTLHEMASVLAVNPSTVKIWAAHGLLNAHAYTDKPEYLYEPPGAARPSKAYKTVDSPPSSINHARVFERGAV